MLQYRAMKTNVGAQHAAPTNADAFANFQQFNQSAKKVLLTQKQYANWLLNRPYPYQRRDFYIDECYCRIPDQLRASVLPKTAQLNLVFEALKDALRKCGGNHE